MQGALYQLVSEESTKTISPTAKYTCAISDYIDLRNISNCAEWLRQLVVYTTGDMSKILVKNKPAKCIQVQPGWWIVTTDCIFSNPYEYTVTGIPVPNKVWMNLEYWDNTERRAMCHNIHVPKHMLPNIRETIHVDKLQRAFGMLHVTDITWKGVPWNCPVKVQIDGVTLFEIPDTDTRMALEIMCNVTSTFHLGNCFNPRRVDWMGSILKSKKQAINGLRSSL